MLTSLSIHHFEPAYKQVDQNVLEAAQDRVAALQGEIDALKASQRATEADTQARIYAVEIELERARGEASTAQARLESYAITGKAPVPLALIILVTAVAVAALVIVLLLAVRMAG